jgi:hypothetical protein
MTLVSFHLIFNINLSNPSNFFVFCSMVCDGDVDCKSDTGKIFNYIYVLNGMSVLLTNSKYLFRY